MSIFCKTDWKPRGGWSLVAGRFKGTDKTYFYVVRGQLMCDLPLTLQCPAAEDGYVYSNPFTIEYVLARFGAHIEQDAMLKLGHYLPPKRELRILVGDELRDVTSSYLWGDIEIDPKKGSPKLKEAIENWQNVLKCEAKLDEAIARIKVGNDGVIAVKEREGDTIMGMNCGCKNDTGMNSMSSVGALGEVLFYWHDEVHDRIGEIVGQETSAVRKASTKTAFVEQMAAQIVEFERQSNDDKWDAEARARRNDRLCSLLMDWIEVPKVEADEVLRLDRVLKVARDLLEREFESLFVRAKVVPSGSEAEWLRAVGIYDKNGFDFDVRGDARRFISEASGGF